MTEHAGEAAGAAPAPVDETLPPASAGGTAGVVRFAAGLVAAAIILAGLYLGQDILVPVALAVLIAFALNPAVTWMTRKGLPRIAATGLAMTAVLLAIAAFGLLLGTQVRTLANDFPTYQKTIQHKLDGLRATMNTPGVLDRALQTYQGIERQVSQVGAHGAAGPPPQQVEIVGDGPSPLTYATTWLARAGSPLATLGIVFLLAFLILLDRRDLRDRLLQLVGDDIHRSTDSMVEAGARVSRYLLMQIAVNVSYGVPMGLGLWLIGVPGALLWGTFAAIMRFVPYVGPLISAVFPLALAFAVDDGWTMVLWTLALIATLELISNNVVEPLLYGSSTGLSAISLIVSAMFWTAIWGPMGLVLSTPLTVCLLVLGRNVPQLRFLDILLGSSQVLDLPSRIYQRLIANDADEAFDIAEEAIAESSPLRFYSDSGVAMLRVASADYRRSATAEHRLRFANGMDALLDALRDDYPAPAAIAAGAPRVLCLGGKWDVDAFAADMTAHALTLDGAPARALPSATLTAGFIAGLDLRGVDVVCISYFSRDPAMAAKHAIKRLRLRSPALRVVIAAWNADAALLSAEAAEQLGASVVVATIEDAVMRIKRMIAQHDDARRPLDPLLADPRRLETLTASKLLDPARRDALNALCKRAAEVFSADLALISALTADQERFIGQSGPLPKSLLDQDGTLRPAPHAEAPGALLIDAESALIAPDLARSAPLADNPLLAALSARFYAAAPLRTEDGAMLGTLTVIGDAPRDFSIDDGALLEKMAADALEAIGHDIDAADPDDAVDPGSATLGQRLPE